MTITKFFTPLLNSGDPVASTTPSVDSAIPYGTTHGGLNKRKWQEAEGGNAEPACASEASCSTSVPMEEEHVPASPLQMASLADEPANEPAAVVSPFEELEPSAEYGVIQQNMETTMRELSPDRLHRLMSSHYNDDHPWDLTPCDYLFDMLDRSQDGSARWCRAVWEYPTELPLPLSSLRDLTGLRSWAANRFYGRDLSKVHVVFVRNDQSPSPDEVLSALVNAGIATRDQQTRALEQLEKAEAQWVPMSGDVVRAKRTIHPFEYVTAMPNAIVPLGRRLEVLAGMHSTTHESLSGNCILVEDVWGSQRWVRRDDIELISRAPEHREKKLGLYIEIYQARSIYPAVEAGHVFRWANRIAVASHCANPSVPYSEVADAFHNRLWPQCMMLITDPGLSRSLRQAPAYEKTLAEPLGSFDACLRLNKRVDVANFAASITSAFGVLSTVACFGDRQMVAKRELLRVLLGDMSALDVAAKRAAKVLLHVLGSPVHFATSLTPLASSSGSSEESGDEGDEGSGGREGLEGHSSLLRVRVSVSLRKGAFFPANDTSSRAFSCVTTIPSALLPDSEEQTSPRGEITRATELLFRVLGYAGPALTDDYRAPLLPLATVPTAEGTTKGEKKLRAGAVVNRLLDATEKLSDARTATAATPAGLKAQLRPAQQRALAFMLEHERSLPVDFARLPTPNGYAVYYGRTGFCLRRPPTGGFLLQEMGIGKSVETLALVLANGRESDDSASPLGTLIVCPVTLLANWKAECEKLLPKRIRWLVLNSAAKKTHSKAKLATFHVVITSYGLLDLNYDVEDGPPKPCAALQVKWRRVIFDESQALKAPMNEACSLSARLDAPFRWCLSGTPCPNQVGDFHGQLVALQAFPYYQAGRTQHFSRRLDPAGNKLWVQSLWAKAQLSLSKQAALQDQPLLSFLSKFAFRSTKASEALSLPPLTIVDDLLEPYEADATQYAAVYAKVREQYERLDRGGNLGTHVARLSTLLMRLRLACDHPKLGLHALQRMRELGAQAQAAAESLRIPEMRVDALLKESKSKPILHRWLTELVEPLVEAQAEGADGGGGTAECVICMDEMVAPTITACERPHMFCLACLLETMTKGPDPKGKCPMCRSPVAAKDLRRLIVPEAARSPTGAEDAAMTEAEAEAARRVAEAPQSAKIDALVTALKGAIAAKEQSVVFTHFIAFQALVSERLTAEGIEHVQILGSSSQSERAKALQTFTAPGSTNRVFLLSMRCASVGLTLTAASRLFLMEPPTSLAQEQQAIGRLHRFGQTKPVTVVRYALKETVEERILTMHSDPSAVAPLPRRYNPNAPECPSVKNYFAAKQPAVGAVRDAPSSSPTPSGAASSSSAASSSDVSKPAQQALDLATLIHLLA